MHTKTNREVHRERRKEEGAEFESEVLQQAPEHFEMRFIGVAAHAYKSQSCHTELSNCRPLIYQDETLSIYDEIISQ